MTAGKRESTPRLSIDFTYDVISDNYFAHLSNGATIPVPRDAVSGKLANTLSLFRSQVIQMQTGKRARPAKPSLTTQAIADAVAGFKGPVTKAGKVLITLEDLGL